MTLPKPAKVRKSRATLGLAAATASLLLAPCVSMAAAPQSLDEAKAAGDPAATASAVSAPNVYEYNGKPISLKDRLDRQLTCVDGEAVSRCYDTPREANDVTVRNRTSSQTGARTAGPQCGGGYALLFQYYYAGFGSPVAGLDRELHWYDNGSDLNNETSSYRMGEHSGHMSDYYGGGGYWLPYDTGVCALKENLNGTGWSDRVSSRYRN
jgi:hypothetical protein